MEAFRSAPLALTVSSKRVEVCRTVVEYFFSLICPQASTGFGLRAEGAGSWDKW